MLVKKDVSRMKPFAQSCEQNKQVILDVIKPLLSEARTVLEIGSGTGQHAVHFAQAMPHLLWQPSDREEAVAGIQLWLDEYQASTQTPDNILPPLTIDVTQACWPELKVDAVFSANTLHIMHWDEVKCLFERLPDVLVSQGCFLVYGPFNYNGQYTSDSNRQFDQWLKDRDPLSAIRDLDELVQLARAQGLYLKDDIAMPANNRILYWQKS